MVTSCNHLFPTTKSIPRSRLFGLYLHALSSHSAPQYELICMKSTNAEHEERLFGQAKDIALGTTDRKANSIIPHEASGETNPARPIQFTPCKF